MSHTVQYFDVSGQLLRTVEVPNVPSPLDPTGTLATLLAVVGTLDVDDAANAVGLTADDLVAEAQAWAMGDDVDPLQYNVI
jgi:hypothetical protein